MSEDSVDLGEDVGGIGYSNSKKSGINKPANPDYLARVVKLFWGNVIQDKKMFAWQPTEISGAEGKKRPAVRIRISGDLPVPGHLDDETQEAVWIWFQRECEMVGLQAKLEESFYSKRPYSAMTATISARQGCEENAFTRQALNALHEVLPTQTRTSSLSNMKTI